MKHTKKTHAFTLVELIVVITIIAILGAIAFTAFNGFQSGARDSSRASDLANLSQALDTSYVKLGSYPNPDNAFTVTYSGGSLWYQGTVGDTLVNTLSSNGSKLSKKPTDPLNTTKEYAYSKSAYGNTYELKTDWEGDSLAYITPASFLGTPLARGNQLELLLVKGLREAVGLRTVYAASGNPTIAYIKGNYNGMVSKTQTGSTIYVIATPSITTSTGTAGSTIDVTTLSGRLLYSGQTNSGGIAYTPTLIYSGPTLPTNDDSGQITNFTTNLQSAYTNSPITSNSTISNLLSTTGSTNITSLGAAIITNYLGGSASAPPPPPATSYNISNSLMFDSGSSQYLVRTPSTAPTDGRRVTVSLWIKRGMLGSTQDVFSVAKASGDYADSYFNSTDQFTFSPVLNYYVTTSQVFRDPSAYYHFVCVYDSTQSTSSDIIKLYVNGKLAPISAYAYPAPNTVSYLLSTYQQLIATRKTTGPTGTPVNFFDGYLSDTHFIDGQALDPTAFGYTDTTTNQWLPKAYTGTYGTNGFHLDFASGATTASLGLDSASIDTSHTAANNWTLTNISTGSQVIDTPLNNFATLNPLNRYIEYGTLNSNKGNLSTTGGGTDFAQILGTIGVSTGKWYFEGKLTSSYGLGASNIGFAALPFRLTGYASNSGPSISMAANNGASYDGRAFLYLSGSANAWGSTYTTNDIIGVALDADTGKIWFSKNNTWQTGDPNTGTSPATTLAIGSIWAPILGGYQSGIWTANFGQGGQSGLTYSTNAGGYFKYAPPTGFKALSTANLPTPTIVNPKQYFDVLTYAGNSSVQSISSLGFQPDLVWIKDRTVARQHDLYDSVRGPLKRLYSNLTDGEGLNLDSLQSFNSNGFTLSGSVHDNGIGENYVAWNWKKGVTPGFDIVTYTGSTIARTVTHSLGNVPKMIIVKSRTGTRSWGVYHASVGSTGALYLDLPNATNVASFHWNDTPPTSSIFSLGIGTVTNSAEPYIAYLWSEIPGFSKFGSYTGNGSADGPFVYTGFRPRYVMWKRTDTIGGAWFIYDTVRSTTNIMGEELYPNDPGIAAATARMDFVSNGFKLRAANPGDNTSGATYIYAAFAEAPFKYANAR